jgi:hypothetical protein
MKIILMLACCFAVHAATAQELFTYSEPASNMPSKSFALRANNYLMQNKASGNYSYAFAPEIMLGVSKKLMFHVESFLEMKYAGLSLTVHQYMLNIAFTVKMKCIPISGCRFTERRQFPIMQYCSLP